MYLGGGDLAQKLQNKKCDKSEGYVFHILSDALSQETQNKLQLLQNELSLIYPCEICIHCVDESMFIGMCKWGFEKQKNYSTYYRLTLSHIIPQDIEKCLYLDVDMLVLCDLRELFAIDLGGCIAGVNEAGIPNDLRPESLILESIKEQNVDSGFDIGKKHIPYYFCAGLMLLNMPLYRVNNIESQCLEFLKTYKPLYLDQDALNVVLNGRTKILPPEYGLALHYLCGISNTQSIQEYVNTYMQILPYTKIAHYNACAKPWRTPAQNIKSHKKLVIFHPYYKQWWDIALQTPVFNTELKKIKTTHYNPFSFCLALIIFILKFTEKYYIRPFAKKIKTIMHSKKS